MLKWLAFLLFLPFAAFADDNLPAPLSDTVSDFGDLLSPDAEQRLVKRLQQARKDTGVHVVVVTMRRREDFAGQGRSIEDYAKALFNEWGVGDSKRNDGVLILVARDDREMRIQLGAGYGSAWDGVAQGVVDQMFLPSFRNGNYETGINLGTAGVIDHIATPFAGNTPAPAPTPPAPAAETKKVPSDGSGGWLLLPLMLLIAGFMSVRGYLADLIVRLRPCPKCGKKGLSRVRATVTPATYSSSGRGQMITTCDFCDYREIRDYVIPERRERTSSSGGSGGGFGGGRSSGGGATGRW